MEYEDITNDDEDEDVREPIVEEHQEEPQTGSPKKEIEVKYDDDDDEQVVKIRPSTNFGRQQTSAPPATTTFQPRLTQFVDVFVNNQQNNTGKF